MTNNPPAPSAPGDDALVDEYGENVIPSFRSPLPRCPGCVGRGAGAVCGVCGLTIPTHLRRTSDSPSEIRHDYLHCCVTGRPHTHQD